MLALLLLAACGTGDGAGGGGEGAGGARGGEQTAGESPAPSARADGPCRPAPVRSGKPPSWAVVPGVPPPPMPYALGTGDRVAAFLFVAPLKAKLPRGAANKVLWVLDPPSGSAPLTVSARRQASRQVRRSTAQAGDGEGTVHRSRLIFGTAGCWRLTLQWGERRAVLDVRVV